MFLFKNLYRMWSLPRLTPFPPPLLSTAGLWRCRFALAFARIENWFFVNKGWFPTDEHVLHNLHKIRHIPCVIVQGRCVGPIRPSLPHHGHKCMMIVAWPVPVAL